jgi:hypothetical protein
MGVLLLPGQILYDEQITLQENSKEQTASLSFSAESFDRKSHQNANHCLKAYLIRLFPASYSKNKLETVFSAKLLLKWKQLFASV